MIAVGPAGAVTPLRTAAEPQPPPDEARNVPSTVSGSVGDAATAANAETNVAVDPATQVSASEPLPKDQSNDEASAARGSPEPSRADAETVVTAKLDEETPAGPPPTFDLSILEKTRAVESEASAPAPPPVPAPSSQPEAEAQPTDAVSEEAAAIKADAPPPAKPANDAPEAAEQSVDVRTDPTPRGAPDEGLVPGETA